MDVAAKKTIREINIKNDAKALNEIVAGKELSVIKASEVEAVAKIIDIKYDSEEESGEDLGSKSAPMSTPGAPRTPRDWRLSQKGSLGHGSSPLPLVTRSWPSRMLACKKN